jgi:hypothetical protein
MTMRVVSADAGGFCSVVITILCGPRAAAEA